MSGSTTRLNDGDAVSDEVAQRSGRDDLDDAQALANPSDVDAIRLNNAAAAADRLGDGGLAEGLYRQALILVPAYAATYANLGRFLHKAGRVREAQAVLEAGFQVDPKMVDLRYALAALFWAESRLDEAEAQYRELLQASPDQLRARVLLGALLLTLGRVDEGGPLYEGRFDLQRPGMPAFSSFGCPPWQGEPLEGRSLLVCFEEGYGDQIQYCRYVPQLKARGVRHVTMLCRPATLPVFRSLEGIDRLVTPSDVHALGEHDYWTLLMSLPFRLSARLDNVPAAPYLAPPRDRQGVWSARMPGQDRRVGLVWRGNPAQANDANRSLPSLSCLRPFWDVPGIRFVSLQKGAGEAEAASPPSDQAILNLGSLFQDFGDSAAVIDQLDLLISVDSAPAHLAGALNKPVWLLLGWLGLPGSHGRWGLEREDSPWYPSLRVFRQGPEENWEPVIARMTEALAAWARV